MMLLNALAMAALGAAQPHRLHNFHLRAIDGRRYDLRSLTAGKPCLIFFLRPTVGDLIDAKTYKYSIADFEKPTGIADINRLATMSKGKMRVAGFSYMSAADLRPIAKRAGVHFLFLGEDKQYSSMELIDQIRLGADGRDLYHLQSVLILPDGTLGGIWPGYSRASLAQVSRIIAKRNHARLHLDLSKFPRDAQRGVVEMYGLPGP